MSITTDPPLIPEEGVPQFSVDGMNKLHNNIPNRTTAVRRVATQVRTSQRRLEQLSGVCIELNLNWQGEWLGLLAGHLKQAAEAIDLDADMKRHPWRGKRRKGE